jgi:8-oxo-dGTP diphosphatase
MKNMTKNNQKIGVSQKAILVDKKGKILAIRRSKTAPSRPLHWDLPGGDLEFGEDAQKGILREIKEETGLKIKNLKVIDAISGFNNIKEFWVTICYVAKAATQKVVLSYEHDDFRWIKPEEFQKLKASPRNKEFVKNFQKCCGK